MIKIFIICFAYLGVILLLPAGRYLYKKYKINQWCKALNLHAHFAVFNQLYESVDGFSLSKQARQDHDAFEYTYGEIEFLSFIALLSLTHPDENTRFYDLGSGTGKAVLAAAMVYDMESYCGVELFKTLYDVSVKQQKHLSRLPEYEGKAEKIEFIHADFLTVDLSKATLIFINSTAFVGETWQLLNERLVETAFGATIITISKKLTSSVFSITKTTKINMSWGPATVYIQVHQGG
jgi:SAM-dependent methyltransferase